MFDPVNEPSFRLDVAGLPDAFDVLAFTGREAISEPFVFEVDLLIDDPTLDLASLLYRGAFLQFETEGNGVHGQLLELVQREHGALSRLCRVRMGPKLACLAQRFSQRMFCARSVPQILDQVLKEHGITGKARRFEFGGDYPPREFCTQYRESDLQFFQRLCAEAGLHYHFEHQSRGHCLVISDGPGPSDRTETLVFRRDNPPATVCRFEVQGRAQATPVAEGRTDLTTLRSGQLMPLAGHPISDWNQLWRLTHIEHQGGQHPVFPYSNTIRAIPWEVPFMASQKVAKPRMSSLQRAWVVDVEAAHPDPSRPVAVQFDWLYQGEGATPGHCWLPWAPELRDSAVAQLREGTEVVVSFIEGDPDQPLITGLLQTPLSVSEAQPASTTAAPDGLLTLLQSSEPLVLLCLLPGGGSFSHCRQAVCTCRAATLFGQSGAA